MIPGLPHVSPRNTGRLLMAVGVLVPAAIVLVVIVQEMRRSPRETGLRAAMHVGARNRPSTISAQEILGTYLGRMRKENGITELMLLQISKVDAAGGFAYTLNIGKYRKDGEGSLRPDGGVTMGNLHGRVEREDNAGDALKLQSWPPDQLPIWQAFRGMGLSASEER
ncbi:MAG: hypothetical protein ACRD3J_07355 [Thermoanaerobaculia bacterium]